ncbi:MAG: site-specific integrase, partial [Peptococcaceae bacterium]|nr:site-specific integrase [Peptococcaceae bacterium]
MSKATSQKPRQDKGDGSIRFNQKSGKWEARYVYGRLPNGKPDRRSKYAKTEGEAKKFLREMRKEADTPQPNVSRTITVDEHFQKWLKVRKLRIVENTHVLYRSLMEHHIAPYIGTVPLINVTSDHCQSVIHSLIDQGYSHGLIKQTHTLLGTYFKSAMIKGDIVRSPMLGVACPGQKNELLPKPKEMRPLTTNECRALIDQLGKQSPSGGPLYRLGAAPILMLCTGIRIGEALALKWTDVDWENKVLHIQRNYTLAEVKT